MTNSEINNELLKECNARYSEDEEESDMEAALKFFLNEKSKEEMKIKSNQATADVLHDINKLLNGLNVISFYDLAIYGIKRQMQKPVEITKHGDKRCPMCGHWFKEKSTYCPTCSQKIDWSGHDRI